MEMFSGLEDEDGETKEGNRSSGPFVDEFAGGLSLVEPPTGLPR